MPINFSEGDPGAGRFSCSLTNAPLFMAVLINADRRAMQQPLSNAQTLPPSGPRTVKRSRCRPRSGTSEKGVTSKDPYFFVDLAGLGICFNPKV